MTAPGADLGIPELVQRMRHRLVETVSQLRMLRKNGWSPDALRVMHEDIGHLRGAAERVRPELAEAIAPLLQSLQAALSAPSLPSATQTGQMLTQAADALAALPVGQDGRLADANAPATPSGNPSATSAPPDPFRVLVVEDDRSQALFAEAILRGAGMVAEVVARPEQTIAQMERFQPDLILMDLHMPGISGTELTMQIREHPRFAGVPVVFLTGDQDPERQLEVLEHGADDYIVKPVRPRHLVAAVQSRVRRARAATSRQAVAAEPDRHPVTGLYTRPALMHRLAALLPAGEGGALLVEVGNTAALRNRCGYVGFEKLMNDTGRHLGGIASEHAVARLSDNAFLVVMEHVGTTGLDAHARTLRDGLGYHDFTVNEESLRLRCAVGHASLAHGFADVGALLGATQEAARDAHGQADGVAGYTPPAAPAVGSGDLLDSIRNALAADGLHLAFPQLVAVGGGSQAQFRVLLRMTDGEGNKRLAGEFLPVAEAAGLLPQLDRWTMQQSLTLLQRRRAECRPLRLFVSQSPRTLAQDAYAEWLIAALETANIDGTFLVIDLRLEDALVHSMMLRQFCEQLVPTGVQFCLSRYRHGADAEALLQQLPLGYLRLAADYAQQPLPMELRDEMREAIDRAHQLGLQVIGQRFEDPQPAAALWIGGIDFIQGNLVQSVDSEPELDFHHATL